MHHQTYYLFSLEFTDVFLFDTLKNSACQRHTPFTSTTYDDE